jgi:hypothetical protein
VKLVFNTFVASDKESLSILLVFLMEASRVLWQIRAEFIYKPSIPHFDLTTLDTNPRHPPNKILQEPPPFQKR